MAVQKYTARRKLEVVPAGAKAQPEAMSQEAGAMAGFGKTVMSFAQNWQNERDTFEISKIQTATNDFHYGLMRQLEDDWMSGKFKTSEQFEQAESDYEKARDKNISNMLKGKRGRIADNVRRYTDATAENQSREFFNSLYTKEKEFRAVEIEKSIESAVQRGARGEAEKIISQGEHWLGLGKAKIIRDNLDYQFAAAEIQKSNFLSEGMATDPLNLQAVSEITTEKILNYVDLSKYNLTPGQRDDLIRYADGLARKRANDARNMLAAIQEQTDVDFFGEYFKGTLDPADIAEAVAHRRLDRASGDRWLNALANPKAFLTNFAVEADLLRRIEDPTELVTKKDILDLMGDGLSVDDTRRFLADIDAFKDPWFTRADRFLKDQLGWSDTYTKFMHPEGAITYHTAMNQLFTDIETQKLSDKAIYERAINIGIPYIVDYWQNVLSLEKPQIERMTRMLRGKTVTPKKTKVGPLREPEIKLEYDPLGIFK